MKRLGLALLLLVLYGCPEHEPQALYVQANIAPDNSCVAQPQVGSQALTVQTGVLDLAVNRYGYFGFLQLVNFMAQSQQVTQLGPGKFHLENNIIQVHGTTVSYEKQGLDDVDLPSGFFVYTPLAVFPNEAAVAVVNMIPPTVVQALRRSSWFKGSKSFSDQLLEECYLASGVDAANTGHGNVPIGGRQAEILVTMTFEGSLQDGTLVYSNQFKMPIVLCNGCLISPQMDSGLYLQQVQAGNADKLRCDVPACVDGQDMCSSYASCFNTNFLVDPTANDVLTKCATDGFATASSQLVPPNAASFIGTYDPNAPPHVKLSHLQFRYAFDKVNAHCLLLDEAPLWPTAE